MHNFVIPNVTANYYELGIQLYEENDVNHLETIQQRYATDTKTGCTEMFKTWLQIYGDDATWGRLMTALQAPGLQLNASANDIMRAVVKG